MKTRLALLLTFLALVFHPSADARPPWNRPQPPPQPTSPQTDLGRLDGRWFEQARIPNPYQRNDSRWGVEYSWDGSRLIIRNGEILPNGKLKINLGAGTLVPGGRGTRLNVQFQNPSPFGRPSQYGNYIILSVSSNYDMMLVGTPDRGGLWIYTRDQWIGHRKLNQLINRAAQLGYPVNQLVETQW